MYPILDLKGSPWWKKALLFIPAIIATVLLFLFFKDKYGNDSASWALVNARGKMTDKNVENTRSRIADIGNEIERLHAERATKQSMINEIEERRGRNEDIDRAVAAGDFDAVDAIRDDTRDRLAGREDPDG